MISTREERLQIYKEMLKHLKDCKYRRVTHGFCHALTMVSFFKDTLPDISSLPELMKYKPKELYFDVYLNCYLGYWFSLDDYDIRINILESIIKDMESINYIFRLFTISMGVKIKSSLAWIK